MANLSVIVGPPLSGKTTFVQSLSEQGVMHISVGNICRDEAKKDTEIGRLFKKSIQTNAFLDSEVLLPFLLDERMISYSTEFVLDGYPKYRHEVEPLLQYTEKNSVRLFKLYHLHVDLYELLRRLHKRYTCGYCYLPIVGNVQCVCGGMPFKREEDTEEYFIVAISRRKCGKVVTTSNPNLQKNKEVNDERQISV